MKRNSPGGHCCKCKEKSVTDIAAGTRCYLSIKGRVVQQLIFEVVDISDPFIYSDEFNTYKFSGTSSLIGEHVKDLSTNRCDFNTLFGGEGTYQVNANTPIDVTYRMELYSGNYSGGALIGAPWVYLYGRRANLSGTHYPIIDTDEYLENNCLELPETTYYHELPVDNDAPYYDLEYSYVTLKVSHGF